MTTTTAYSDFFSSGLLAPRLSSDGFAHNPYRDSGSDFDPMMSDAIDADTDIDIDEDAIPGTSPTLGRHLSTPTYRYGRFDTGGNSGSPPPSPTSRNPPRPRTPPTVKPSNLTRSRTTSNASITGGSLRRRRSSLTLQVSPLLNHSIKSPIRSANSALQFQKYLQSSPSRENMRARSGSIDAGASGFVGRDIFGVATEGTSMVGRMRSGSVSSALSFSSSSSHGGSVGSVGALGSNMVQQSQRPRRPIRTINVAKSARAPCFPPPSAPLPAIPSASPSKPSPPPTSIFSTKLALTVPIGPSSGMGGPLTAPPPSFRNDSFGDRMPLSDRMQGFNPQMGMAGSFSSGKGMDFSTDTEMKEN